MYFKKVSILQENQCVALQKIILYKRTLRLHYFLRHKLCMQIFA